MPKNFNSKTMPTQMTRIEIRLLPKDASGKTESVKVIEVMRKTVDFQNYKLQDLMPPNGDKIEV